MQNSPLKGRALVAATDLVSLVQSYGVQLKKEKGEYVGLCPFHADNNPSFFINAKKSPQQFCCTPCSFGGSALDFIIRCEESKGHYFPDKKAAQANAFRILETGITGGVIPQAEYVPLKAKSAYEVLLPVPPNAPPPVFNHNELGLAAQTWTYRDAAGQVLFYAARFNRPDGRKDVLPLSYVRRGEAQFWKWHGHPLPRPLYGLDRLAKAPASWPVLLVEGEKTADAANKLFAGQLVAMCWPGGSNQVHLADYSPLKDRNVLLWPDNDSPGVRAMFGYWKEARGNDVASLQSGAVHQLKLAGVAKIKAVANSPELPEGWDIADGARDGWDSAVAMAYLSQHTGPVPQPEGAADTQPAPPAPEAPTPHETVKFSIDNMDPDEEFTSRLTYRALGYRKESGQGIFSFYSYKAKHVYHFSPAKFTKAGLLQLASKDYWTGEYGTHYDLPAAEALMNECYEAGTFDPDTVRGIGAWLDKDRVVVHAGTHLVEGGSEHSLADFNSKFLYEADREFEFSIVEPLSSKEAIKFAEVVNLLTWERPALADLFIGWCVVAPVCGALNWRPHIWLTGPAGSGKTTAMSLLKKVVGNITLSVQGNTSEAGIRQLLRQDARPVCFDEADSDGFNDSSRLQSILSLVRASSSHDGGGIAKGGAHGTAQTFLIRSCFAFASITPKTANAADRSRVSVLTLTTPPQLVKATAEKRWQEIEAQLHECFSPERCAQLRARTLSLLPQLLENAKVFARAAGVVLGEQRAGDQLGILLAGAYSLRSRSVISFDEAKKYVAARNWDEIRNDEKDEFTLLAKLLEQPLQVRNSGGGLHERNVGELILMAANKRLDPDEVIDTPSAVGALKRIGMKVEDGYLYVSNTADWIAKALRSTAWATNHGKVLARIPGAAATEKNTCFTTGIKTRAVKIPISVLTE